MTFKRGTKVRDKETGDIWYIEQEGSCVPYVSKTYEGAMGGKRDSVISDTYIEILEEVVGENKLTNNKTIIMSLVAKFKSIVRTEPEKTLVKVGVLDEELSLTTEGKDLFLQFLFEKNKVEFKTEVADKLVEVEK